MATHDYVIDNSTGANVRADINNALAAIVSNNSSSSEPSTKYAYQWWADTSASILKIRNSANDGWINLFTLAGGLDVDAASNFNEDVTFTGASANIVFDKSADDLIFNDNAKAVFGTSSDGLEIFHNASDSIINDNGTGSLKLQLGGATKAEVVSGGFTVTGTVTATAFSGDGSGLTGAGTTINNNADNRVITGSGTAATLNGEANLTYDGSNLDVTGGLNVTSDVSIADTIKHTGDTDTKIRFADANTITTENNGSETVRINANGEIAVLFNSPRGQVMINSTKNALVNANCADPTHFHLNLKNRQDTNNEAVGIAFSASSTVDRVGAAIIHNRDSAGSVGSMRFYTSPSEGTTSERARITKDGSFHIGSTVDGQNTGSYFQQDNNSRRTLNVGSSSTSTQNQIILRNGNGRVGTIQTDGSSTSYNTSFSDRRAKKNFEKWEENVLNLFKKIKPQKFHFKVEDDSAKKQKGYVAQDMLDLFPEAYKKEEDEMYMFNPSGMVVYLMKAIQELESKVAILEAAK
tara:strand:+ start:50 stop:1618 length:1569 start_codon:yes stop_codon:yes gene_type:complete